MYKHVLTFCVFSIAVSALAQSPAGPSSSSASAPAPASASSGTYSIEAEMLAYQSLQVNSQTIATDIEAGFPSPAPKAHLLVIPSASTVIPAFQQWRANMAIVDNYERQYSDDGFKEAGACPVDNEQSSAPSFSAYTTAIGEGVAALQGILGLFANSQAVTEYPGTIQDQALITAVSGKLKAKGFQILIPDVYTSWAVADVDTGKFPFLHNLKDLISEHASLQKIYQCNTLIVSAGSQLQQAEITRETDYITLAGMDLTKTDPAKVQSVKNDIASMTSQIEILRGKIGIKKKDAAGKITQAYSSIQTAEGNISTEANIIFDAKATSDAKTTAVKTIQDADASVAEIENPILLKSSLKAAQSQGLVAGIESYLAGLTGGAVSLSSPAVAAAPVTATASTAATGGSTATATGASSPAGSSAPSAAAATPSAPAAPAAATPSSSAAASTTPPILTILQMDGLARKMGLPADTADCLAIPKPVADGSSSDTTTTKGTDPKPVTASTPGTAKPADTKTTDSKTTAPADTAHCSDTWRILWLKAMESGGADINESNIFGSHPHFGGGAVSGYALFGMDGTLSCSGNVAAYGGYVKSKDFTKQLTKNTKASPASLLKTDGGCADTDGSK